MNKLVSMQIRLSPKTERFLLSILVLVLILVIFSPYLYRKLWQQPLWNKFILTNTKPPSSLREHAIRAFSANYDAAFITGLIRRGPQTERYHWIIALAKVPGHQSCDVFLKLARDKDNKVRDTAFRYLVGCNNPEVGALFVEGLTDQDYDIQAVSVGGLGQLREKRFLGPMVERLRKFEAPDVLSDVEIRLGQAISDISGKYLDFSQKCCAVKGIWPHSPEQIQLKRTCCDNRGPVKARAKLLRSLDK